MSILGKHFRQGYLVLPFISEPGVIQAVLHRLIQTHLSLGFPGGASGKERVCQCRRHKRGGFHPWMGKIPRRRAWQPTLVFLPGESHGQRSLVGYSPEGCKELDTTEVTQHAHMLNYKIHIKTICHDHLKSIKKNILNQ